MFIKLLLNVLEKKSNEQFKSTLAELILKIPEHHRATLKFVMAHLCRICSMEHARGNKNPPTVLTQVMCHILLRPPWDRIMYVNHSFIPNSF